MMWQWWCWKLLLMWAGCKLINAETVARRNQHWLRFSNDPSYIKTLTHGKISFQIVWLQEEASKPYLPCGLGEKQRGTLTRVRLKVYTRTRRSWKHHPIDKIKMSCIKIVLPRKTSKIIQDLLARSCWDCCYFRLEILLPAHSSKILTTSLQGWLKKIWIFLWHIIPSMTHGATKRSDFYTDSKPWTENSSGAMGAHLLRDSVLGPSSSLLNNLHKKSDNI
jgi:hypothetical protein